MTYVNAGHIPPFILRSGGRIDRPAEGDLPAGLLPGTSYRQHCVDINPGDLIVCVSDGIMEAENPRGELWDGLVVEETLQRDVDLPVHEILTRLVRAVDDYAQGSDQADDMTAVILRVLPSPL